ncbi:MAG: DNA-directed RNA polymerase subunit omega [Bacilli bacterium]|nr:DNA-directed RNA polymerase subunit omega [Bacilli bacterium]
MSVIRDGMRYPSIDQLVNKSKSKYKLVIGAAKRAKDITKDKKHLIENPYNTKSIGIALEEIYLDKIVIVENVDTETNE